MPKTIDDNFIDWHNNVFRFGYGTGEEHTIPALKKFLDTVGKNTHAPHSYDYRELESALTAPVAWLLINILCNYGVDVIEYGTSPRCGWLTPEGKALKAYVDQKTVDELYELVANAPDDYFPCDPEVCDCGPHGYQKESKCRNPFWKGHH